MPGPPNRVSGVGVPPKVRVRAIGRCQPQLRRTGFTLDRNLQTCPSGTWRMAASAFASGGGQAIIVDVPG